MKSHTRLHYTIQYTCFARSVYWIFSSSPIFAHRSPRIRVTLRLSKWEFLSLTILLCLLQKIRKAFIGRRTSFLSTSGSVSMMNSLRLTKKNHSNSWNKKATAQGIGIYKLIPKLRREASLVYASVAAEDLNRDTDRRYTVLQQHLEDAWSKYKANDITTSYLLKTVM